MSRVTSTAEHFGDADLAQTKTHHVLEWVRRRVGEAFEGETSSTVGGNNEDSQSRLLGDRRHLVKALFGSEDILHQADAVESLLSLRAEVVHGGATNIAARVWSVSAQPSELRSLGLFVKIGFPYLRWARDGRECPVTRLDREFVGLKRLNQVCPGVTSCPVICGSDEAVKDGTRYLAIEHLPLHFEKYALQFRRGKVAIRPAQALGFTLAKLHVQSPRLFDGMTGVADPVTKRVAAGFYERVAIDIQAYLRHGDFKDDITTQNFWIAVDPVSAQKHTVMLRNRPEILRAVSRQLENFRNPPTETASLICVDSHVLNILVSTNPPNYPYSHDNVEYDPGKEAMMKLIDLEFYNWGPSGADFGMFLASAFFYALVYSYSDDVLSSSDGMIQAIAEGWKAYWRSYIRHAQEEKNRTESSISVSLVKIAHEVLGWAGTWMCRFASPSLFPRICLSEFLYPLPSGLMNDLSSRVSGETGEDGVEILRSMEMEMAVSCLVMGFGDETHHKLHHFDVGGGCSTNVSPESANQVIANFVRELTAKRNKLHQTLAACSRRVPSE